MNEVAPKQPVPPPPQVEPASAMTQAMTRLESELSTGNKRRINWAVVDGWFGCVPGFAVGFAWTFDHLARDPSDPSGMAIIASMLVGVVGGALGGGLGIVLGALRNRFMPR